MSGQWGTKSIRDIPSGYILDFVTEHNYQCFLGKTAIELAEGISLRAAIILIQEFGGGRVSVPHNVTDEHRLNYLLGEDDFARLIWMYQGEEIEVPAGRKLNSLLREHEIYKHHRKGLSQWEIANKYGITERGVRKILRRHQNRKKI